MEWPPVHVSIAERAILDLTFRQVRVGRFRLGSLDPSGPICDTDVTEKRAILMYLGNTDRMLLARERQHATSGRLYQYRGVHPSRPVVLPDAWLAGSGPVALPLVETAVTNV
jgi:hypothetical protein